MIKLTGKVKLLIIAWLVMVFVVVQITRRKSFSSLKKLKEIRYGKVSNASKNTSIITVGKDKLMVGDLEEEYKLHTAIVDNNPALANLPEIGGDPENRLRPLKQILLEQLIERKLIINYLAKKESKFADFIFNNDNNLCSDETVLKDKINCEKNIVESFLKDITKNRVKVSGDEILEYYENNKHSFTVGKRVVIQHILVATEQAAKQIRYKLNSRNFSEMAKKHSIAPEATDGGFIGPFEKGDLPPVFDAAFNLPTLGISPILKSSYGFHIILLKKKNKKGMVSLEEAKPNILSILRKKKSEKEYEKCLKEALSLVPLKPNRQFW